MKERMIRVTVNGRCTTDREVRKTLADSCARTSS
jgi:hypothetical protein